MRICLMLACALLPLAPLAMTAPAQAGTTASIEESRVIAEVLPLGYTVTAVALRMDRPVQLVDADAAAAAFEVLESGSIRPVIAAYGNSRAERSDGQTPGDWLILELQPQSVELGTVRVTASYTVRQGNDVELAGGVLRASPTQLVVDQVASPVVDHYESRRYDGAGMALDYRLFQPEAYTADPAAWASYPLVLTLHGYGESGIDNAVQLTANQLSTAFAEPDWQREHPAFVVSPQLAYMTGGNSGGAWGAPATQDALLALVESISSEFPIDRNRVYIAGLSMGSIGAWDLLVRSPDTFAGAVLTSYGGEMETIGVLAGFPVWNFHSVDDEIVSYSTSLNAMIALDEVGPVVERRIPGNLAQPEAEAAAREHWDAARAAGANALFTYFTEESTGIPGEPFGLAHASWIPAFSNDVHLEWLFAQSRPPGVAGSLVPWGIAAAVLAAAAIARASRGSRPRARQSR